MIFSITYILHFIHYYCNSIFTLLPSIYNAAFEHCIGVKFSFKIRMMPLPKIMLNYSKNKTIKGNPTKKKKKQTEYFQ